MKTSGIRVGSPAGTTRGFGPAEFEQIGHMVADVLDGLKAKGEHGDPEVEANVRAVCVSFAHAFRSIRIRT
jgi:glycine hydroxymethyltransferase